MMESQLTVKDEKPASLVSQTGEMKINQADYQPFVVTFGSHQPSPILTLPLNVPLAAAVFLSQGTILANSDPSTLQIINPKPNENPPTVEGSKMSSPVSSVIPIPSTFPIAEPTAGAVHVEQSRNDHTTTEYVENSEQHAHLLPSPCFVPNPLEGKKSPYPKIIRRSFQPAYASLTIGGTPLLTSELTVASFVNRKKRKKVKLDKKLSTSFLAMLVLKLTLLPAHDTAVVQFRSYIQSLVFLPPQARKRVAIVQIRPFKQPVVYDRCYERKCRILRGNCVQVYAPQPLYILTTEGGEMAAKLDFILVEAGCQCQSRPLGESPISGTMGVDATVPEALRIITGGDFDEDYFTMLAAIDAASAIAGLNQATTRPAVTVTTTSNLDAPIIDPQEVGNPTTVIHSTTIPLVSSQTEMITSSSSLESSHDLSSENEITSPSPPELITITVPPLPKLPDHGHPILILPGQFNPLLLLLKKFLR